MLRLIFLLLFAPLLCCSVSAQSPGKVPARGGQLSAIDLRQAVVRVRSAPAHGHARVKQSDLQLRLCNVLIDSTFLWFHLQLDNRSRIAFRPAYCRFTVRDRRGARRRAVQSVELTPYRRPILGTVRYHHPYDLVIPFLPFALVPTQQLVIAVGESQSGRVLQLVLSSRTILHAACLP